MNDTENDLAEFQGDNTPAKMEGFPLAPPGWYPVMIIAGEKKATNAGDGYYANLQIQIIEGDYKGTTWFHMLNLWNKSEKSANIAKGQLNCYKDAVGKPAAKAIKELLNIPFLCSVGIKKGENGYRDSNCTKDAEPIKKATSVVQKSESQKVGNLVQTPLEEDEIPSFQ